ncbi:ergothioneine biosynthesis glutamate--cysteine ligase EgtA [Planomonospora venezuelensis]|uniref:Glutamate--cysteine ligase EgtA n=1 Tax=Planomonospora venezuelensis TaxID=1999 RepID=A0A841DDX8_PLAVE|nr:ergothioneine biosynthesis glutamate--cysteine ligase EgtA [Planomonospora venezuelensis]MBB5967087.1 glutamate--cysteine ligase [Planomonospora venezuelensis]GIN04927.1 glutamate--cysteine ligase EgtA [Planomonospora venezuelensis]
MTGLAADETPIRDRAEVEGFARDCFGAAGGRAAGGDRVGVELEFLVFDRADVTRHVPRARIEEALPRLTGGSRVTFEPGGQLELSGPAGPLAEAIAGLEADVTAVREALREAGLALAGVGLDPVRPPRRQLRQPRYDAMAEFLGAPYGPLMMCSTASIQVNLDLGGQPATRWERAHLLGPVLGAAFANSPLAGGRPTGWMSGRQAVWENLDRTRTAPVPATGDPAADWAEYLLDARLMLVREDGGGSGGEGRAPRFRPVLDGSTFRDWLGASGRPPTLADLAYHATTLFPPVRPRGWLEIRYLDAQHPGLWPVCAAVAHALVTDDRAAGAALAACEPYRGLWSRAARCGLRDPLMRRAAEACFRTAVEALPRLGASAGLVGEVAAFADRYVAAGRSPADDLVDLAGLAGRSLPDWLTEGART